MAETVTGSFGADGVSEFFEARNGRLTVEVYGDGDGSQELVHLARDGATLTTVGPAGTTTSAYVFGKGFMMVIKDLAPGSYALRQVDWTTGTNNYTLTSY